MNELQYMEFSLYGRPFAFRWPRRATTLNPLDISDVVRPENAEAFILAKCAARSRRIAEYGTQYGLYSVIMASALPRGGSLVGLEVLPLNAQISNENLRTNNLADKGIVFHAAASEDDEYDPAVIDLHSESANVLGFARPMHGIGTAEVPRFSLKRLEAFFGPFDMIKMDVEGYEACLVSPSAFDMTDISIAAIEVHPHAMHQVFGRDPVAFMHLFPPDRYVGFLLIGRDGRMTMHDLSDEDAVLRSVTANAYFFKRGYHDDLVEMLRRKMDTMNNVLLASD